MGIPTWAERALEAHKPRPSAFSRDGQPDAVAMQRWTAYTQRFRDRWNELEAHKWKLRPSFTREQTSYDILACAIACAKRLGKGQTPAKVIQARRDLLALDREISDLAADLASKFRVRAGMENDAGIASWRVDTFERDPMDFWDALEMAFNPYPGSGRETPQAGVWKPLLQALNMARGTSLSVPEWPDVLEVLGEHFEPGTLPGDFPNITETGHETNKSEYSPWCKALIQHLDEWNLLPCLTHAQLSGLANVALNAPGNGEINDKQIGSLVRSYRANV